MRDKFLNGGAYSRSEFVAINKTVTAGGAGDATEVDGAWVDRVDADDHGIATSAKLIITYTATLGQGNTLSFGAQFRDATSLAGAGAADYESAVASTVVATGDSAGSVETGTVEIDIELSGANQFVQAQITPNLDRATTDTCEWSASLVLYGDHSQPQTKAIATLGGASDI